MRVSNMKSSRGNAVPNQFVITGNEPFLCNGEYLDRDTEVFQSYETIIARRYYICDIQVTELDRDKWDYSRTTSKYRNQFLDMNTGEIEKGIVDGSIKLVDLN